MANQHQTNQPQTMKPSVTILPFAHATIASEYSLYEWALGSDIRLRTINALLVPADQVTDGTRKIDYAIGDHNKMTIEEVRQMGKASAIKITCNISGVGADQFYVDPIDGAFTHISGVKRIILDAALERAERELLNQVGNFMERAEPM